MIIKLYSFISIIVNWYNIKKNRTKCGKNNVIKGIINIKGNIILGNNVYINSNIIYNPIGGSSGTSLITNGDGIIIVGDNVGISNTAIFSHSKITIEKNVMIGGNCKLYDTDFHSIKYEYRIQKPDTHINTKPIHIKEGAFIGAHSIILKGVTIGKHSVVGAGSVVTHDIPDNEIWAGNPAKFVKRIED